MLDFFLKYYFIIFNEGVIVLAGLFGILSYSKFKGTNVRFFIFFLIYIVFIELLGYYPSYSKNIEWLSWIPKNTKGTIFEKNILWYTVFWNIGSALFVTFYFSKILENKKFKAIIKYGGLLFLLVSSLSLIINYQGYYNNQRDMFIVMGGMIQIMLCVLLYFYEILMSDKIIAFYKSFHFYVAAAFFIWFLVMTPIAYYQKYYNAEDEAFVGFRRNVALFSNMLLYLTFVIAFIKCKPQNLSGEIKNEVL